MDDIPFSPSKRQKVDVGEPVPTDSVFRGEPLSPFNDEINENETEIMNFDDEISQNDESIPGNDEGNDCQREDPFTEHWLTGIQLFLRDKVQHRFLKSNFMQLLQDFSWIGWRDEQHLACLQFGRVSCVLCKKQVNARDRDKLNQHANSANHKNQVTAQQTLPELLQQCNSLGEGRRRLSNAALLSGWVVSNGNDLVDVVELYSAPVQRLARSSAVPRSATTVAQRDLPEAVRLVKNSLIRQLHERPITVFFDGSRSMAHNNEYLIVQAAHPELEAPVTLAVHIFDKKPDAEALSAMLTTTLADWEVPPHSVAAFCCDNERVNLKTLSNIRDRSEFSHAEHLCCVPHGLALIMRHVMKLFPEVDQMINLIRTLLFANPSGTAPRLQVLKSRFKMKPHAFNAKDVRWGTKFQALSELCNGWSRFGDFLNGLMNGDFGNKTTSPIPQNLYNMLTKPMLSAQAHVCSILLEPVYDLLKPTQSPYIDPDKLEELRGVVSCFSCYATEEDTLLEIIKAVPGVDFLGEQQRNELLHQAQNACAKAVQVADKYITHTVNLLCDANNFFGPNVDSQSALKMYGQHSVLSQHRAKLNVEWFKTASRLKSKIPKTRTLAYRFWKQDPTVPTRLSLVATRALAYSGSNATVERGFSTLNRIFMQHHRSTTSVSTQSNQAFLMLNRPYVQELVKEASEFAS